eukprot:Tamp_14504.p1 GENE.Tamp_14504~~Tamp_14504.p1  ORF type:complete len:467 (-),score=43.02 Tamp_14504:225-1415(-)
MAHLDDDTEPVTAAWRTIAAGEVFAPSPFPSAVRTAVEAAEHLSIVMISDTHSKHGSFAGYEVPTHTSTPPPNPVLSEIIAVMTKTNHVHETVFRRQGAVHAHIEMEIKPVLLLSGNRKSIAPSKAARPAPGESADGATAATPMDGMVIPYADVLIHAGDFTMKGSEGEVESFAQFLAQLPHPYKIVVAGNHDVSLDEAYYARSDVKKRWKLQSAPTNLPHRLKLRLRDAGVIYLDEESAQITTRDATIQVFGSGIQPRHHDWAFQRARGAEIRASWQRIPTNTQLLVTHGPPLGRGDRLLQPGIEETAVQVPCGERDVDSVRAGCADLLEEVRDRVRPRLHVFGHVHRDVLSDSFNGATLFVNAALCDRHNNLRQNATVKSVCLPVACFRPSEQS